VDAPVDLLVVGGGVIGLAIAREAALAGLSVRLVERGEPGGGASGASAGMLAAQLEAHHPGPLSRLCLTGRDLYPEFLEALRDETGVDVDVRTEGALVVARGGAAADDLERQYAAQLAAGLEVELVDAAGLLRLEPSVTAAAVLGLLLPREWSLDPVLLVRALRRAAERAGAQVATGREVLRVAATGGRVSGVVTADGAVMPAGRVVLAAGAWSGQVRVDGAAAVGSEPVRGQIVCFRAPGLLRRIVHAGTCYLVPRGDGRLLVGSTMEHAGYDPSVTAEGLATLAAAALAVVPGLGPAALHGAWAGLRPASPDSLPVIGRGALDGLFHAGGHLRNGIVLAPLTGRVVVRLVRGDDPGIDLGPFDPLRFAGTG
jgi:glycine oxidase